MPKICVEIEIGDDGTVRVGVEPYDQEAAGAEEQEKSYMQPAKSVEDALGTARDLLSGATGAQAQAAQAEGDFRQGFNRGAPMGKAKPPMPEGM